MRKASPDTRFLGRRLSRGGGKHQQSQYHYHLPSHPFLPCEAYRLADPLLCGKRGKEISISDILSAVHGFFVLRRELAYSPEELARKLAVRLEDLKRVYLGGAKPRRRIVSSH
jgi:hypothetical protein